MSEDREQKLIDILFEMVYRTTQENKNWKPSRSEAMYWVAKNLWECGFKTMPIGISWGRLTEHFTKEEFEETWKTEMKIS